MELVFIVVSLAVGIPAVIWVTRKLNAPSKEEKAMQELMSMRTKSFLAARMTGDPRRDAAAPSPRRPHRLRIDDKMIEEIEAEGNSLPNQGRGG